MKPRKLVVAMGGALLLILGVGLEGSQLRALWYHWVPRNFAVVEPGRLYRGAYQFPGPLRWIIRTYGIKSILTVREKPCPGEPEVARDLGLRYYVVPIQRASQATDEELDSAAAILANPDNYPIFFHCRGGRDRTNIVLSAYRMRHCGWSPAQAMNELKRYGFRPDREPQHCKVILRYAKHVTGSRT